MALAYKRGEMDDASEKVKELANSMSEKDLEDFAKTKHDDLPQKVKKEAKENYKVIKVVGDDFKNMKKDRVYGTFPATNKGRDQATLFQLKLKQQKGVEATLVWESLVEAKEKKMTPDEYKQNLIKNLPRTMALFDKMLKVDGWKPSKKQWLDAIETGYIVMKRTGDVQKAGKAVTDEINTMYAMSKGRRTEEVELDEAKADDMLSRTLETPKKQKDTLLRKVKKFFSGGDDSLKIFQMDATKGEKALERMGYTRDEITSLRWALYYGIKQQLRKYGELDKAKKSPRDFGGWYFNYESKLRTSPNQDDFTDETKQAILKYLNTYLSDTSNSKKDYVQKQREKLRK